MTGLWATWEHTARCQAQRVVVLEAESGRSLTAAALTTAAAAAADPRWRGQVIPFCLPNGIDWFVRFLAIQYAGGIAAPLDPSLSGTALDAAHDRCARLRVPRGRCCLKLTSGSTGDWRVVPCTAAHLLADGQQVTRTMQIRPRDRNLAIIPLGHSYGLGNLVLPLLQQATPVVCTSGLVPRHLLEVIERHGVTVLPTVPVVLRALALTPGARRPPSLRLVISAGAPLSAEVARQFRERFGMRIHNFYGSTETGGIAYDRTGWTTLSGRSVGRPLTGVTVSLTRDRRVRVASRAVALPGGRHTLADRGAWTDRGELRLTGRVGLMANIGGKKVAPAEVETVLRTLAGVADAWVAIAQNPQGNDYLIAAVETRRGRAVIERQLATRLPAWKLPRRLRVARTLPRTDRGKLDTARLREMLGSLPPGAHRPG